MINEIPGMTPNSQKPCISWSAIFIGALTGIGLNFLLNLFCLGVGLSAFNTSPDGETTFMVGGFIGLALAAFVGMFSSGWITGYLARPYCVKRNMGEIYGFAAWCLSLVFMIMLASQISALVLTSSAAANPVSATPTHVRISSDTKRPAVTAEKNHSGSTTVTVNPEKTVNALGASAFATFFLFFIAALASAFGGRCGMSCDKFCRKREGT